METLRDMFKENAERYEDHPCIKFHEQTISYRQLDERSNQVSNFLMENGVKKGDIVSIMVGNSPEYLYLVIGAAKTGAIAGPVNNWWLEKEVNHLVQDSEPVMMAFEDRFMFIAEALEGDMPSVKKIISVGEPEATSVESSPIEDILATYPTVLQEEVPLTGDDVASIMYTSGTTGFPKGALITHGGLIFANDSKQKLVDLTPEDVVLCVLPLFFSGGLVEPLIPGDNTGGEHKASRMPFRHRQVAEAEIGAYASISVQGFDLLYETAVESLLVHVLKELLYRRVHHYPRRGYELLALQAHPASVAIFDLHRRDAGTQAQLPTEVCEPFSHRLRPFHDPVLRISSDVDLATFEDKGCHYLRGIAQNVPHGDLMGIVYGGE